jgi:hypothetical protein
LEGSFVRVIGHLLGSKNEVARGLDEQMERVLSLAVWTLLGAFDRAGSSSADTIKKSTNAHLRVSSAWFPSTTFSCFLFAG